MTAYLAAVHTPAPHATLREVAEGRSMAAEEAIAKADDRGGEEGVAVIADGRTTLALISDEIPTGHAFQFASPAAYRDYMRTLRAARSHRLAPINRARIAHLTDNGLSAARIAAILGCSERTVVRARAERRSA